MISGYHNVCSHCAIITKLYTSPYQSDYTSPSDFSIGFPSNFLIRFPSTIIVIPAAAAATMPKLRKRPCVHGGLVNLRQISLGGESAAADKPSVMPHKGRKNSLKKCIPYESPNHKVHLPRLSRWSPYSSRRRRRSFVNWERNSRIIFIQVVDLGDILTTSQTEPVIVYTGQPSLPHTLHFVAANAPSPN